MNGPTRTAAVLAAGALVAASAALAARGRARRVPRAAGRLSAGRPAAGRVAAGPGADTAPRTVSVPRTGRALPVDPGPDAGSSAPPPAVCAAPGAPPGGRAAAWARLLRVSALFTVPGDALAGAAAASRAPNRGTLAAVGASLCLYEAGMALNDWADRHIDAVERPERPLPSGRISPPEALAAAAALTAAGLGCAAAAGRTAFGTATVLAGAVWAYDLGLKHTPAGPAAMAAARSLDLLLGAVATGAAHPDAGAADRGRTGAPPPDTPRAAARSAARGAAPAAALLGAHTLAVTTVSRRETVGGSTALPLGALAAVAAVAHVAARPPARAPGPSAAPGPAAPDPATVLLAAAYAATAARPLAHAALNPSPPLYQRAVGGGIRAMIPLQAVLAARAGSPRTAVPLLALLPLARLLSRKVSPT
ncbi:SCO3242 family prenyltransferase [Streptomyces sp. Z26]|uniref:SCO3242 family prenyltransferase n=1 Tax=Streptomyces sp. Z26 TaxID=2500177 RepID=UPI0026D578A0